MTMNNKPVAYGMFIDGDFYDAIHADEYKRVEGKYDIPLYTHPVKELTDEEITDIWLDVFSNNSTAERQLIFARAILRKASEK